MAGNEFTKREQHIYLFFKNKLIRDKQNRIAP